ncbi:MAG: nitroreductase family protein [candidate division Zixibacteria bacterium]|nr:nitroreductase family protein [candidate division Zixibacteria bacterium]
MDILEFIKSRRSIRKFLNKPIEKDHITKILEAARWAPSAGNCQPWQFLVVTNKKKTNKFDPFFHQPWVLNAPAVIVVLAAPDDTRKRYGHDSTYFVQDCAAATQNILLMAHGLGLGAVWVGAFSKEAVRDLLDIPSKYEICNLVCLGHYKADDEVILDGERISNKDKRGRKSLGKIAFEESLENPWTAG